jgi:hypothetical protein
MSRGNKNSPPEIERPGAAYLAVARRLVEAREIHVSKPIPLPCYLRELRAAIETLVTTAGPMSLLFRPH